MQECGDFGDFEDFGGCDDLDDVASLAEPIEAATVNGVVDLVDEPVSDELSPNLPSCK